jgi:hypothetical protein
MSTMPNIYQRKYYWNNREKILEKQRIFHKKKYQTDPEYRARQIARNKKRYAQKRSEILEYLKKYRETHPRQQKPKTIKFSISLKPKKVTYTFTKIKTKNLKTLKTKNSTSSQILKNILEGGLL